MYLFSQALLLGRLFLKVLVFILECLKRTFETCPAQDDGGQAAVPPLYRRRRHQQHQDSVQRRQGHDTQEEPQRPAASVTLELAQMFKCSIPSVKRKISLFFRYVPSAKLDGTFFFHTCTEAGMLQTVGLFLPFFMQDSLSVHFSDTLPDGADYSIYTRLCQI